MKPHEAAALFSLWLTPMTIIACAFVVYRFYAGFVSASSAKEKTELHWFIIGIVIGFAGDLGDNIFWAFAWSAQFTNQSYWTDIFEYGAFSNSIFRQGCGIVSALCHLRGVSHLPEGYDTMKRVVYSGTVFGFVFVAILMAVR